MNKKIIMISGHAQAGKDSTFNFISTMLTIKKISFADPLKKLAKEFFEWNGEKDIYGRKLLIFLGGYIGNEIKLVPLSRESYLWNEALFNDPIDGWESGTLYWSYVAKKIDNFITKDKLFWSNIAINKINNCKNKLYGFSDFRYLKEYVALSLNFDNITTIRINRDVPLINSKSETDLDNFKFDYVIDNNGTLDDLRGKVENFVSDRISF